MKILVTGAGGSCGSYLVEHLLANDSKNVVVGLVRRAESIAPAQKRFSHAQLSWQAVELMDFEALKSLIQKENPDQIYHIASHARVGESFQYPREVLENNIKSTINLLDALRVLNIKPKTLICSTSEVYGQVLPDEVPIRESNALRPASPYAVSKLTQDMLAQVYFKAYGIPVVITRMFTYFNPRRRDLFATSFAMQVAEIEAGLRKVLTHGNLESVRTMIDIRDAMDAYVLTMEKGVPGEIYNLGGQKTLKVGEFLELLKKRSKVKIEAQVDASLLRPVDVTLQIPDTSKFEKLTGWRPQKSWDESVDHLLEECRQNVKSMS